MAQRLGGDAELVRVSRPGGPFVMARRTLEPQGRWEELLASFTDLVARFNLAADGGARIRSGYFVVRLER